VGLPVEKAAACAHTFSWSTDNEKKGTATEETTDVVFGPPTPTVICGCWKAMPFGQQ